MDWLNLRNPAIYVMKKYLSDILKERFPNHIEIIERIGTMLQTDKDLENFGKLVADLYEVGYFKSIEDHKKQLADLGYKIKINSPEIKSDSKIFK